MRRNYKGSDHLASTINHEYHQLQLKTNEENARCHANDLRGAFTGSLLSNPSIVMAEAISMEEKNQDDEESEIDIFEDRMYAKEKSSENGQGFPATGKQLVQRSLDKRDAKVSKDRNLVQIPSVVAPGYVPSEFDERIILELPSLLVRALRVVQGTFQVSFIFNIV